jgi:large repetitive protein
MSPLRFVAGAIVAGTITLAPALHAGAEGYGTLDTGTVTDKTPAPGQAVDVVISGFKPKSDVTLVLHSDPVVLGTFAADDQGVLRVNVTIPPGTVAGGHSIVATGVNPQGDPVTASIAITVPSSSGTTTTTSPPGSGGLFLPRTGSDIAAVVTVGGILVMVGAATVTAVRRRPSGDLR